MFRKSRQGAIHIIAGSVPLNAESNDYLKNAVEQCLGDGPPLVVFDLSEVPLIDSAGLELLLTMQEQIESHSGTIKLAGPNPLCRDILNATGLIHQFEIHRETKAAVGSFLH
jgi:anti-sigma B factor antagonist